MAAQSEFDGRRYSAVAVKHDKLQSIDDLAASVAGMHFSRARRSPEPDAPSIVRADWHHAKNLYPYGSSLRRATRQSNGHYRHRCLVAQITNGREEDAPTFVFASPHISVVGAWCVQLEEALEHPRPRYAVPRLNELFHDLGTSSTAYRATQITLQIPSDVDVEKVALTGKSPLISSLRLSLEPVTRPYAVRLELAREAGRPVRMHLDRHGNYWWYQANDQAFEVAVGALASLDADQYLGSTHDIPTRRIVSEDSFA